MGIITKTKNKLNQSLPEATIKIIDNSINHVGHGSSGAHLELEIIYHGFEGKTLIQQYQIQKSDKELKIIQIGQQFHSYISIKSLLVGVTL